MADDVLPTSERACKTCRYGGSYPGGVNCRRFPTYVLRRSDDWCGEYAPGVRGGPRG